MDCSCDRCQSLCCSKPGWFMPQEIELVARKLNVATGDLFKRHLTIDAVLIAEADRPTGVYVLAPAIVDRKSAAISDPAARGSCVWFKNGKCDIHEMKPAECRATDHSSSARDSDMLRASILKQWVPYKKFVQNLYGKKLKLPVAVKDAYRKVKRGAQPTMVHGGGASDRA